MSLFAMGIMFFYCNKNNFVLLNQSHRLDSYVNSDIEYIANMFFDENMFALGIQPALTNRELYMLDLLVDRIEPEVRNEFDQKYFAWLICWSPLDSFPEDISSIRESLKCNGQEFMELIDFCKGQSDDVFLLFYQLAARANCPYDQLLLHPTNDLLNNFPDFNAYWQEVDLSLQKEKPQLKNRTCNEPTIWYIRKILESKYENTFNPILARLAI